MGFRFLHTADLHLDSPLRSLALRDPDLAGLIADASRGALRAIVDLALAEQVDAVLIAGDLYDGGQTSMKTARYLTAELGRLNAGGIRAYIIRGNHDAESLITRELTLPPLTHVFTGRAGVEMLDLQPRRVAIHGLSFREPRAPESLLPKYRPPLEDAFNIGLMHTSLGGAPGHDPYAPCALGDLQASGFDYWALGHIHKRAEYAGAAHVVMPGIPQGRDIGEPGAGSVTLGSVDDAGTLRTEERVVALAEFARVEVSIDGVQDWGSLRRAIAQALTRARGSVPHVVARLDMVGDGPLAPRLHRDADLALAEAQEIARGLGHVWVEKLGLRLGQRAPRAGALGELAQIIASDVLDSHAYHQALDEARAQLVRALPDPTLRKEMEDLSPEDLEIGLAEVLARLEGSG